MSKQFDYSLVDGKATLDFTQFTSAKDVHKAIGEAWAQHTRNLTNERRQAKSAAEQAKIDAAMAGISAQLADFEAKIKAALDRGDEAGALSLIQRKVELVARSLSGE